MNNAAKRVFMSQKMLHSQRCTTRDINISFVPGGIIECEYHSSPTTHFFSGQVPAPCVLDHDYSSCNISGMRDHCDCEGLRQVVRVPL